MAKGLLLILSQLVALCLCLPAAPYCSFSSASSAKASSVSKDGITYIFDQDYTVGQFITGDYWVVGPVKIVQINPPEASGLNGFMVNPKPGAQALDSRGAYYEASLLPSLPVSVAPNSSVIKVISLNPPKSGIAVLTLNTSVLSVVSEVPPNNGATSFRPPYIAAQDKPMFTLDDVDFSLFPNLSMSVASDAPSYESIIEQLRIPFLDFLPDFQTGQFMPSFVGIINYGAVIQIATTSAVIRTMFEDLTTDTHGLCAYALITQYGIDVAFNLEMGDRWPANGGWANGRKLPASLAAVTLGSSRLQQIIQSAEVDSFGEDNNGTLFQGVNGIIWGDTGCPSTFGGNIETGYWKMITAPVAKQDYHGGCRDPYGYIDGGQWPGSKYQGCCTSHPFKDETIALNLMPALRKTMNVEFMVAYAQRWVSVGVWTQPDPCAPATGTCSGGSRNGAPCSTAEVDATGGPCRAGGGFCSFDVSLLGVKFGPDGSGGCIKGSGRFPLLHGYEKDGGLYPNPWVDALWSVANHSTASINIQF